MTQPINYEEIIKKLKAIADEMLDRIDSSKPHDAIIYQVGIVNGLRIAYLTIEQMVKSK